MSTPIGTPDRAYSRGMSKCRRPCRGRAAADFYAEVMAKKRQQGSKAERAARLVWRVLHDPYVLMVAAWALGHFIR